MFLPFCWVYSKQANGVFPFHCSIPIEAIRQKDGSDGDSVVQSPMLSLCDGVIRLSNQNQEQKVYPPVN